jgi:hypothetical protein
MAELRRAEQSFAEQSPAKDSMAELRRAEQSFAEQSPAKDKKYKKSTKNAIFRNKIKLLQCFFCKL